jgi:hypothetical protein
MAKPLLRIWGSAFAIFASQKCLSKYHSTPTRLGPKQLGPEHGLWSSQDDGRALTTTVGGVQVGGCYSTGDADVDDEVEIDEGVDFVDELFFA